MGGDDTVHRGFAERIERAIGSAHEIRFDQIAAVAVVLKLALVQLHVHVRRLEVQRRHLATHIPENLQCAKIDFK